MKESLSKDAWADLECKVFAG